MKDEPLTIIGETTHRNEYRRFGIRKTDRLFHIAVLGKTGTGKSTLLEGLMKQDARHGEGFALIDPHGDLAKTISEDIPTERREDLFHFNPVEEEHQLGFNILDNKDIEPALVVSGVVSVFQKIWDDSWGPRLEYILRNALWSLVEAGGRTLSDVPRILLDAEFRKEILEAVRDERVLEFWEKEYGRYSQAFKQVTIAPILNKLGQFLLNPYSRAVLEKPQRVLNIRRIMDEGKILIANLAKGQIGEDASSLLGSMLLTQCELAALNRVNVPMEERRNFYLYIDEFPSVATEQAIGVMAESRKYRLSLVVAMQFVEQLEKDLRDAVFENVGTLIVFRVGPGSARFLAQELRPVFGVEEILALPRYEIYLRLMIDGVASRPFSARTILPVA